VLGLTVCRGAGAGVGVGTGVRVGAGVGSGEGGTQAVSATLASVAAKVAAKAILLVCCIIGMRSELSVFKNGTGVGTFVPALPAWADAWPGLAQPV